MKGKKTSLHVKVRRGNANMLKKKVDQTGLNDPLWERDFVFLLKNYLTGEAIFDILANVPMLVYKISIGMPAVIDQKELGHWDEAPIFWTCMTLQFLRLFHYNNVTDIIRRIVDTLQEIFFLHRYLLENIESWTLIILQFLLFIHYFACAHVFIYSEKQHAGYTAVEFSGDNLYTIYVDSFYLITTTITTVGYGDFKGYYDNEGEWLIEMIFLMVVMLVGIMVFSTVTNEIFQYKVVLSMSKIV